jgi:hypothetical protein
MPVTILSHGVTHLDGARLGDRGEPRFACGSDALSHRETEQPAQQNSTAALEATAIRLLSMC